MQEVISHVVPVMLTFYDTDCKTVIERSRSRVCINSKENENIMSFNMHIITFFGNKGAGPFTRGSRL